MNKHRNSQKRFYNEGYTYFVTGVTQNRHPYFEEEIFCEVFWENLKMCQAVKEFVLHGWFLGYDHFHLLLTLVGEANISQTMKSIKGNSSCDINRIMNPFLEGEVPEPRLQEIYKDRKKKFFELKSKFHQKHPNPILSFPKFMWQKSFHDHVIRNERDHETHLRYIEYNPLKHNMPEGWRWWATSFASDVVRDLEF